MASLAAWTTATPTAQACSPDPCWESNRWTTFELAHDTIATDGVLVFRADRNGGSLPVETALEYVAVEVTDALGVAVPGALEALESPWHGIVWRPTDAWVPGESYGIALTVDNTTLSTDHDEAWINEEGLCGDDIAATVQVQVGTDALVAFALEQPEEEQSVETFPQNNLDSFVCCDDAMPVSDDICGATDAYWNEGFCTPSLATGHLSGWLRLDPTPAQAADIVTRLVVDGDSRTYGDPGTLGLGFTTDEPFCARLEALSVSRGDLWVSDEICFGEGVADQLGSQALDPTAALDAQCVGEPYVCANDGEAWDPAACEPWTNPDGDDGDSGDSGNVGDTGTNDGDGDGDGSGGDGSGGPGADGGNDGINSRGCSCSTTPADGLPWMLWTLVAVPALRRRRRS